MEQGKFNQIIIETTVKAPVDKVWEIWTEPKHIVKWNSASDDWHTTSAQNDLRVGGRFSSRMEAKDQSFGFDFSGIYDKVEKCKEIAYTLEDERRVEVLFSEVPNGTRVVETFEAEGENTLELQKQGWQAILDHFKAYTEGV